MKHLLTLITEDDRFLADAYEQEFKDHGFSASIVADGVEALDFLKKKKPAIVILDLIMPRKNGVEVLKAWHEAGITKKIPVIVVSNLENAETEKKCLELGAKRFVLKSSIVLADLVKICKEYLKPKTKKAPTRKKKTA